MTRQEQEQLLRDRQYGGRGEGMTSTSAIVALVISLGLILAALAV
jgi:hypothetical protein